MTQPSKPLDTLALQDAITRLTELIAVLDGDDPPEKFEKLARAVSAQLKALRDIEARNADLQESADATRYTRYEDMPPPSPEDRARFIRRFERLYGQVTGPGETAEDLVRAGADGGDAIG